MCTCVENERLESPLRPFLSLPFSQLQAVFSLRFPSLFNLFQSLFNLFPSLFNHFSIASLFLFFFLFLWLLPSFPMSSSSFPMSSSSSPLPNLEDQKEELASLVAIYGENFVSSSDQNFEPDLSSGSSLSSRNRSGGVPDTRLKGEGLAHVVLPADQVVVTCKFFFFFSFFVFWQIARTPRMRLTTDVFLLPFLGLACVCSGGIGVQGVPSATDCGQVHSASGVSCQQAASVQAGMCLAHGFTGMAPLYTHVGPQSGAQIRSGSERFSLSFSSFCVCVCVTQSPCYVIQGLQALWPA